MKTLLIIETIKNVRGASEGKALEQGLRVILDCMDQRSGKHLGIKPVEPAFTKEDFKKLLRRDVDYLHISAHGGTRKRIDGKTLDKKDRHVLEIGRKEGSGKIIKYGEFITPSEIEEIPIKAKNVFVSACFGGHKDLFRAFFKDRREGIYLGPCRKVDFDLAFIVALDFRRGAFLDQSVRRGINQIGKLLSSTRKGTYYYFRSPRELPKVA